MSVETLHDHQNCVQAAIASAEALCLRRGVRFTPLRRRVLELIWHSHEAIKAYDLLDDLKAFDAHAKPATVYRALDFLLEQGFIHRVESMNAFIGCDHVETHHALMLLICERCHQVEERHTPELLRAIEHESRTAGFIPHRQSFEIHGICARCQQAEQATDVSRSTPAALTTA